MADDVQHPLVSRGKSAHRKILMLEQALQSRTFLVFGRIRLVTTLTAIFVNPASRRLLSS